MAEKMAIPWELKYKFAMGGWTSHFKGVMYAIRERFGATLAREIFETVWKMSDRLKNMTNTVLNVFKIDGNDIEAAAKWWDIWYELTGIEGTWLERSKTTARNRTYKCPWQTEPKDISDWVLIFTNIVASTINPKITIERPKGMCAGDPYCEYVFKLEE